MEVCKTSASQPEESESMDFSLTPEMENKTVETEPMNTTNPKPLYSYRLVDSWSYNNYKINYH